MDLVTGAPGPVGTVKGVESLPPIGETEERVPIAVEKKELRAKEAPRKEPRRGAL